MDTIMAIVFGIVLIGGVMLAVSKLQEGCGPALYALIMVGVLLFFMSCAFSSCMS